MKKYEYVTKKEYSPVRKEIEEKILSKVHKILKKDYGITFQHKLIGSGNRHLVTRLVGGNTGYDFDYNLILMSYREDYSEKEFKEAFINSFNKAIKGTQYKFAENSTSAITIKVVDQKNKRILHSCDFVIIEYEDDDAPEEGYYYIRNLKDGRYQWAFRNLSKNVDEKLNEILDYWVDGWRAIKDEYIKLKCRQDKHSFVLYLEAINNIYNQTLQDQRNG